LIYVTLGNICGFNIACKILFKYTFKIHFNILLYDINGYYYYINFKMLKVYHFNRFLKISCHEPIHRAPRVTGCLLDARVARLLFRFFRLFRRSPRLPTLDGFNYFDSPGPPHLQHPLQRKVSTLGLHLAPKELRVACGHSTCIMSNRNEKIWHL